MSQNPFASPRADLAYSTPSVSGRLDAGAALSSAWAAMKQNMGVAIGGCFVFGLSCLVAAVTLIGIPLLLPVLLYGFVRFSLNVMDGRPAIGDLFSGFQVYGQALGSMLLLGLLLVALSLPGQLLQIAGGATDSIALQLLGVVVNVAISVTITLRLYFAPYFIVEETLGTMDAIKATLEATQDQKLAAFVITLLSALVVLGGLLALVIGLVVAVPLSAFMYAAGYRQLRPLTKTPFAVRG